MVGQVLPSEGSLRPVGGEKDEIGDEMTRFGGAFMLLD